MDALSYAPNSSIVGLLFSSSYCKYCTEFTPMLKKVYSGLQSYGIEILLVGSDKTKEKFNEYKNNQPWTAIPFDDPIRVELRTMYDIKTIPALVFLDSKGNVINLKGRFLVADAFIETKEPYDVAKSIARQIGVITDDYNSDNEDF